MTPDQKTILNAAKAYHLIIAASIDVELVLSDEEVTALHDMLGKAGFDSISTDLLRKLINHWHALGCE